MKYTCQGVKATNDYLTVAMTVDYGSAIRFATVKVPIGLLLDRKILEAIDGEVRRRLQSHWTDDDPLPGIG